MTSPNTTERATWDERNEVAIRHLAGPEQIDHQAGEPYEFWTPGSSGGPLDIVGLYEPMDTATLIVSFHGSLQRSKYQLPRFEWRQSLNVIKAARLYIADSSLHQSNGIPLAWYVGSSAQNLTADIADLIQVVAAGAGYRNILLTGSSGGGFASLAVSRRIPGSVALCFSPQTRVGDYNPDAIGTFRSVCFPDYKNYPAVEAEHRSRVDLRHLYEHSPDHNYVRYVQNTNDHSHFTKHYTPFAQSRGVDPEAGGLDSAGRIEFVPQSLQMGHEPPSRGRFRSHILETHERFFGGKLTRLDEEGNQ
ncbi:MAG: hypothetical protein JWQ75_227 [Pseudarthrobacter sp.]|nr:hypothetical protein [Pseudarthrobacter sp.]